MNAILSSAADSPYAHSVGHLESLAADDAALARRIAAAAPNTDNAAESELCRRLAPRIRFYGLRHLRSEASAADLVQEVLLLTLQKLRAGAVREPERIASFVLGMCRQLVIDWRRTANRRQRIFDTFALTLPSIVEESSDALDTGRLQHCLERLAERERAVLIMTFYDDRPAEAVGLQLGLSAGNVRVIRHRGIERLRACMQLDEEIS